MLVEDVPRKLNTTIRAKKGLTVMPFAVENCEKDEILERSASKCVAFKDDEVAGCNRNENQLSNRKERSELNLTIGNNCSTDSSCASGECNRDSTVSSQRNLENTSHSSSVCTSPRNLTEYSLSQSELISLDSSITGNINSEKGYEVGDNIQISDPSCDACTIHQVNLVSHMP